MTTSEDSCLVRGLNPRWQADYAWTSERGGPGLATRLFRCRFHLRRRSRKFQIHVSADSRYRLWLNGKLVGFGPAKGSLGRYYFESYDLARRLRVGENVLAAEVRHFGENSPMSEVHSPIPGFLLQGPGDASLDTPGRWRCCVFDAVKPDTSAYIDNAHIFLNHVESLDARLEPVGWRETDFDDRHWSAALSTGPAAATGAIWGVAPMRTLYPRDVAALLRVPTRFARTIENRAEVAHRFGPMPLGWRLEANQGGAILLDPTEYVTAFPQIDFSGGAAREVSITYAEALGTWAEEAGRREWSKHGPRDDFFSKEAHGYRDTIILRGGNYRWEPFYWRAFRFVKIEVLPGPEPLVLRDARYELCVHPQQCQASIETSDPDAAKIFAVSRRTFRVGAHEIYDDSPYFEQLSYIADTRIEALASLHLCNETELPRRNLRLFLDTLRSDGLLDARVPCQYARQTIPYFCLHWIFMVQDYWKWVGPADRDFVRECLLAVDTILTFFRGRLRPDGFVGVVGGWNMVDLVDDWPVGEPPEVAAGGSTYLSSLFVEALGIAVSLHREAGYVGDADRWSALRKQLLPKIRARGWDATRGLFRESAGRSARRYSQHVQAGAINAGIATAAQVKRLVPQLWTDPAMIRTHSMQSFYVARALERVGRFEDWHRHLLAAWRVALSNGVTTWPEYPDPARSDSHAWAAWPAIDYITSVLGIRPLAAGWESLRLAPQTGGLEWASGDAPSPGGKIRVSWRKEWGRLFFEARVPKGLDTELILPGQMPRRFKRGGRIDCDVPLIRSH